MIGKCSSRSGTTSYIEPSQPFRQVEPTDKFLSDRATPLTVVFLVCVPIEHNCFIVCISHQLDSFSIELPMKNSMIRRMAYKIFDVASWLNSDLNGRVNNVRSYPRSRAVSAPSTSPAAVSATP